MKPVYTSTAIPPQRRKEIFAGLQRQIESIRTQAIHPTGNESFEGLARERESLTKCAKKHLINLTLASVDPDERVKAITFFLELVRKQNSTAQEVRGLLEFTSDFREYAPDAPIWLAVHVDPLLHEIEQLAGQRAREELAMERLFKLQGPNK